MVRGYLHGFSSRKVVGEREERVLPRLGEASSMAWCAPERDENAQPVKRRLRQRSSLGEQIQRRSSGSLRGAEAARARRPRRGFLADERIASDPEEDGASPGGIGRRRAMASARPAPVASKPPKDPSRLRRRGCAGSSSAAR